MIQSNGRNVKSEKGKEKGISRIRARIRISKKVLQRFCYNPSSADRTRTKGLEHRTETKIDTMTPMTTMTTSTSTRGRRLGEGRREERRANRVFMWRANEKCAECPNAKHKRHPLKGNTPVWHYTQSGRKPKPIGPSRYHPLPAGPSHHGPSHGTWPSVYSSSRQEIPTPNGNSGQFFIR